MLTKTLQCGSIAGLLLISTSWHSGTTYQLLLNLVVCLTAIMIAQQAMRRQQYSWAGTLVGIVLLLNPIVPAVTPAGSLLIFLLLVALLPFVIGFAALIDATITFYPNLITEPYLQGLVSDASDRSLTPIRV